MCVLNVLVEAFPVAAGEAGSPFFFVKKRKGNLSASCGILGTFIRTVPVYGFFPMVCPGLRMCVRDSCSREASYWSLARAV